MRRHITHQIDQLAQQVFQAIIPTWWVFNEHKNDYAKDYLVEIGDRIGNLDGELTGQSFYVQLKGKMEVTFSRNKKTVSFRLEHKYAKYYAEKVTDLPVFLVLVDIGNKRAWYHFVQPLLLADQSWKTNNKDVTIYVPVANKLENTDKLREAIEQAKRTMRMLHPLSISEAVGAHKQIMEAKDPRFTVDLLARNNRIECRLLPKTPVPLLIAFNQTSQAAHKKFLDLCVLGKQVDVEPGEITIAGSPLFDRLGKAATTLQLGWQMPGNANTVIICKDNEGKELTRLSVPGRLLKTPVGLSFEGTLDETLVRVSFGPIRKGKILVRSPVDISRWIGRPLRSLPYFDQLLALSRAISKTVQREFVCEYQGDMICTVNVNDLDRDKDSERNNEQCLMLLDKARRIASAMHLNPVWTLETLTECQETIIRVYSMLFEGEYVVAAPELSHTITWDKDAHDGVADSWNGNISFGEDGYFRFFSDNIDLGEITVAYENVSVKIQPSKEGPELIDVALQCRHDTIIRMYRETPQDNAPRGENISGES